MKRTLAVAALAVAGVFGLPVTASAASTPLDAHTVTITVDDVSPNTPVPSSKPSPLQFTITVANNTFAVLKNLTISAERGDPIVDADNLNAAIAKPTPGTPSLVSPVRTAPLVLRQPLPGGNATTVTYKTTTATNVQAGICLCTDAIYPLYFTATATDPSSGDTVTVGTTQTYLPAFGAHPHPAALDVTWIWPLLDRPHRLANQRVFTDDDLAGEVSPGGRLDRALQVVEDVTPFVPLTLVVDPDLLDELEVMAAGPYRVRSTNGIVFGSGTDVARTWLSRFTAVIDDHPAVDVELTPFADPDVESLTRNGLTWAPSVGDQDSRNRLAAALGDRIAQRDVAWPYGSTLSQDTLTELVNQGTSTVVVSDSTLPGNRDNLAVNALAKVPTSAGPALAAVTSHDLQTDIGSILTPTGHGLAMLPELVSHLALRVLDSLSAAAPNGVSRYVVLAPPRDLDVDPDVAARTILSTSHTFWTSALPLTQATHITPSNRGVLRDVPEQGLPDEALDAMRTVADTLPGLTGRYGLPNRSSTSAATSTTVATIDNIPMAVQRTASAELISDPTYSIDGAEQLARTVTSIRSAVHLVPPAGNASYTLTAASAPLPITVSNPLDVDAQVRIQVSAVNNVPGFSTQPLDVDVPAGSTQQVHVPTRIEIPGRVDVVVTLTTPGGMSIGGIPLHLSVRNTALGTVGVAITTIAAVVLAIALLVRGFRALRWRMRRRNSGGIQPPETDPLAP